MSDVPSPDPGITPGSTRRNLDELAGLLRTADPLEPAIRDRLADFVAELDAALHGAISPERAGHLARGAADLVRALRDRTGPSRSAGSRLQDAAATAETEAPVASGAARGILEILNELGI